MKKLLASLINHFWPISDPVRALLAHFSTDPRAFRVVYDPAMGAVILEPQRVYTNRALLLGFPLSDLRIVVRSGRAQIYRQRSLQRELVLNWRESHLLCSASRRWCEEQAMDLSIEIIGSDLTRSS